MDCYIILDDEHKKRINPGQGLSERYMKWIPLHVLNVVGQ